MKKIYFLINLAPFFLFNSIVLAQTNPTAQSLPYSENFTGTPATSTTYPLGIQGWIVAAAPGSAFVTTPATADKALTASSTASTNSGNIHNYNGKIGFLNTGTGDLSIALALNTIGSSNINFSYDIMTIRNPYDGASNTRINEVTLQYRVGTTADFINLTGIEYQNNTTTQTTAITTPQNSLTKTITLPPDCDNQPVVQIRWISRQISGAGSRPSFAIDNITAGTSGIDITPPIVSAFNPLNNAINVSPTTALSLTFNEAILKGTSGNILIKKQSDNSTVQTIPITSSSILVSGNMATINILPLSTSTTYYIQITAGAFTDLALNNFVGIATNNTWIFTTNSSLFSADFLNCTSAISDGFTAYSVTGAEVWACTPYGRNPTNPSGSQANGVQINGFAGGTNVIDEDWLISPSLNLSSTTYPLLSFWSRTKYNGAPLLLKVSTNYDGISNPNNFTWTTIDGKFPPETSDIFTLSDNINLAAFKSTHTYFAFVYNSTTDDGARWTLDDISITNSIIAPPARVIPSTNNIQFNFVAAASAAVKTFSFTANDITAPVNLVATSNFLISKTNSNFTSTINYTQAEANNITQTVYVQFSPTINNTNYTGNLTISTTGVADTIINLIGNSIDVANTLEVVNWNLEWFGSTTLGPTNDDLQQQNIQTILQSIKADVYGLVEVVSEPRLASIVAQMPGYSYVICNYGSHANPFESGAGPLSAAQKEAFVYKTALFPAGVTTAPLVTNGVNTAADLTNPAYNYFASGRYPFMMTGTTTLNGVTKTIRFVLLHAKANTSPTLTSYNRRKAGADTLNYTLNTLFPNDNIILLGDINDDLDSTITDGIHPKTTSYITFMNDVSHFWSPTLALSLAGRKSTVSYNDVIDHVILSNEMQCSYMPATANILNDVSNLVSSYGTTTTDHYPVFSRYFFAQAPTSTIAYSAQTFCPVGFANVTIIGNSGGTFSSSAGLVINSTTGQINLANSNVGTYTVTYTTAASACYNSSSTSTNITITEMPKISIAASPNNNLLPNTNTVITATANPYSINNVFTWYKNGMQQFGNTSNTININYGNIGMYTAKITNTQGCSATSLPLTIGDSVSNNLYISPNPNTGNFNIRHFTNMANFGMLQSVTIYDGIGAKIFTKTFNITSSYSNIPLDLSRYGRGIYYVVLSDNQEKILAKGTVTVL